MGRGMGVVIEVSGFGLFVGGCCLVARSMLVLVLGLKELRWDVA